MTLGITGARRFAVEQLDGSMPVGSDAEADPPGHRTEQELTGEQQYDQVPHGPVTHHCGH